jgi:hypothetical protein
VPTYLERIYDMITTLITGVNNTNRSRAGSKSWSESRSRYRAWSKSWARSCSWSGAASGTWSSICYRVFSK